MANFLEKLKNEIKLIKNCTFKKKRGEGRDLYYIKRQYYMWLDFSKYLDRGIAFGSFEKESYRIIRKLLKNGDTVLDIGANIGWYSVIFSKLVGSEAKVICFEPTKYFSSVLKKNLDSNSIKNCVLYNYGLSDKKKSVDIVIGESSASMHSFGNIVNQRRETIELRSLDSIIGELKLENIRFIKVDIDGHEPAFLKGAMRTIKKYNPLILLEVFHGCYYQAGHSVWDFYRFLKDNGFYIYSEKTLEEFKSEHDFLYECGNFNHSANIILNLSPLNLRE